MNQITTQTPANNSVASAIALYVGSYLTISLGAVVALIVLHNHKTQATQQAWVHGIIVATTALLMSTFARGAIRGKARAYLRLRIASTVMIVAIAVTTAIPGDFPMWMKIEQIVCGLLLVGLAVVLNRKSTKSIYSTK